MIYDDITIKLDGVCIIKLWNVIIRLVYPSKFCDRPIIFHITQICIFLFFDSCMELVYSFNNFQMPYKIHRHFIFHISHAFYICYKIYMKFKNYSILLVKFIDIFHFAKTICHVSNHIFQVPNRINLNYTLFFFELQAIGKVFIMEELKILN